MADEVGRYSAVEEVGHDRLVMAPQGPDANDALFDALPLPIGRE